MSAAAFVPAFQTPVIPIREDASASDLLRETLKRLKKKEKNFVVVRFGSGPSVGWSRHVHTSMPDELISNRDLDSGAARRLWTIFNLRGINLRFVRVTGIDTLAYDVLVDV